MWQEINDLVNMHGFSLEDKEKFLSLIKPIVLHKEFMKRYNAQKYPHHGEVSLGKHIIEDAIITYLLVKAKNEHNREIDFRNAVLIAMFHDLYEKPWQNAKRKKKYKVNMHGFIHPIEAVVNAITWYPEYFQDDNAFILIDGIIHHMYPFPVRAIESAIEETEINNIEKFMELPDKFQKYIIASTNRMRIDKISLCKSVYEEGRVLSKADKIVSMRKDLKSFSSLLACVTGKNKALIKKRLNVIK